MQLALVELPLLQPDVTSVQQLLPPQQDEEPPLAGCGDTDLQHTNDTEAAEACKAGGRELPGGNWWGRVGLLSWLLLVHVGWRSLRTVAA
jgi:hypothetical protein